MENQHTLITGTPGSGKTTLARFLVRRSARAIVFDVECEYDFGPSARYSYDLQDAINFLMQARWRPFWLVFRSENDNEYPALAAFAMRMQELEPHGPLVILVEESSTWSETLSIDENLRKAYNRGRKRRITMLTVIQADTDIHRVTRRTARWIVTFQQNALSSDLQSMFNKEHVKMLELVTDPNKEPRQGVHYLVHPGSVTDLPKQWSAAHDYVHQPSD